MTLNQGLYLRRGKPRTFQSLIYPNGLFKRIDNRGNGQLYKPFDGFKDIWIRVADLPLGMWDEDTPDLP